MKSNKQILKESVPNITITLSILAVIFVFRPPFLLLIQGFVALTILRSWYKFYKQDFPNGFLWLMCLDVLALLAVLVPIYIFYNVFGAKGLWSLVAVVFFLAGVILWRVRKQFVDMLRDIERKHWGETREERKTRLKNEQRKNNK